MDFQLRALERLGRGPGVFLRHADVALVRRTAVFVGHLEENQVGELLQIVAVADAVVAEGGAEAPDFGDDGVGGHEEELDLEIDFSDGTSAL